MRLMILFLLFQTLLFAVASSGSGTTEELNASQEEAAIQLASIQRAVVLRSAIDKLDEKLGKDNIWLKKYGNYHTYRALITEKATLSEELDKLSKIKKKTPKILEEIAEIEKRLGSIQQQVELLSTYRDNPFRELTQPDEIPKSPTVSNPIAIIYAFSFIKQLQQQKEHFESNYKELKSLLAVLREKRGLLEELRTLKPEDSYLEREPELMLMLESFEEQFTLFALTMEVYRKKVDEVTSALTDLIKQEMKKSLIILGMIVVLFLLSLLIKTGAKKYISDNERLYTANKIVNFVNVTLIILILLFAYLENVSYLVTVLGFASAGLAIAMKDLFMSILGWIVIILGGSVHVGDRIRVRKDDTTYVGDVLDVSLLRITIHEDVTYTTYAENRRAGRIVFIPNNYVFTTLISNYTHGAMQTVWDGIDITVTFDSDYKKAAHLCRDIAKKYAKGYTDITRKQINTLRDRYSLRNTNVEPRIFHFIEPYGMRISVWYLTNSYATLTLRSTISAEILDAFAAAGDITIAYPTQTVKSEGRPPALPPLPPFEEQVV